MGTKSGDAIALGTLFSNISPPQNVSMASHDYAYITDYSGNQYGSNQIFYDSIGMSLNGLFVDPGQSYIIINHQIEAQMGENGNQPGPFDFAPKNGFPFLYSALVSLDNNPINNNTPSLNMIAGYNFLRQWTQAKCRASGTACAFYPDDLLAGAAQLEVASAAQIARGAVAGTISWGANCEGATRMVYRNTAAATYEPFSVNNCMAGFTRIRQIFVDNVSDINAAAGTSNDGGQSLSYPQYNNGMWQRALMTSLPGAFPFAPTSTPTGCNSAARLGDLSGTTAWSVVKSWWQMYPLRVLCDAFDKVGLMKSRIQINLYLNQLLGCTKDNAGAIDAGAPTNALTRLKPQVNYDTCPILVNQWMAWGNLAANNRYNNVRTSIRGPTYIFLKINRLYPEQLMQVSAEGRSVFWNDYSKFTTFQDISGAKSNVNWNITSGIVNARKLLIWKFPDADGMSTYSGNPADLNDYNQSFPGIQCANIPPAGQLVCTEPAHSTPFFTFYENTQLLVGSTPLYQYPMQWTWLNWLQTQVSQQWHQGTDDLVTQDLIDQMSFMASGVENYDLIGARLGPDEVNNVQLVLQTTMSVPKGYTKRVQLQAFVVAEKGFHIDPAGVVVQLV